MTVTNDRIYFGVGGRGRVGGGPGQGGKLTAGIALVFDVDCREGCMGMLEGRIGKVKCCVALVDMDLGRRGSVWLVQLNLLR
jgi:hypothetical protein